MTDQVHDDKPSDPPLGLGCNEGLGGARHVERYETMLHPELTEAGVRLTVCLSNFCDEDLDEPLEAWFGEEEVSICNHFVLSDALSSAIELHEMPSLGGAIDSTQRPMFMAMRAELQAMIERIDALRFETPNVRAKLPAEAGAVSLVRDEAPCAADQAYSACRSGSA
jgi:hypothetical protein